MSRNIKSNFKQMNNTYMKTLSKQTTDTQYDIDVSSFQTSNNYSNKNKIYEINIHTYTNNSNIKKRYPNKKIKSNSFQKYDLIDNYINNNKNRFNHKKKLFLFNNNTLINEANSLSKYKKKIKAKTKEKINISNIKYKQNLSTINKTQYNGLNISKNSKLKKSKEKTNNNINEKNNFLSLKKSNTNKRLNIKSKNANNSKPIRKIGSPGINKFIIKTNINSPLGSDREEKQIMSLKKELKISNNEINDLNNRINEQNKYISELEEKVKNIIDNKLGEDIEYKQYSKKMIVRNIKDLTEENEELHKQIDEYKEKEIQIMKALYYINKQGISIDKFLEEINNDKTN